MTSKMWFGTEKKMQWIDTPLADSEMSPQAWGASGTLLNGGGYAANSWGSHAQYAFSWSSASPSSSAQLMQAYADGSYGRGLLYFTPPNVYLRNILPKHWADPSMALDYEAPSLRRGVTPTGTDTVTPDVNQLPLRSAVYDLTNVAVGFPGNSDSLLIPVPPGMTLLLGGFYSKSGSGGVFYSVDGGAAIPVPTFAPSDLSIMSDAPAGSMVRIWVGKGAAGAASATITALVARLVDMLTVVTAGGFPFGVAPFGSDPFGGPGSMIVGDLAYGPWVPGMGHTGCRFVGKPTFVPHSPHAGGQASYAVTLKEVGGWLY